jgi:hypothetical protein
MLHEMFFKCSQFQELQKKSILLHSGMALLLIKLFTIEYMTLALILSIDSRLTFVKY